MRAPVLLHELVSVAAERMPDHPALRLGDELLSYAELAAQIAACAGGLQAAGIRRGDRVAVYLPKTIEGVVAMFAAAAAGAVFVPVNPVLKPRQVGHILSDSGARALVTSASRWQALAAASLPCPDLSLVVLQEDQVPADAGPVARLMSWPELLAPAGGASRRTIIDTDMTAILYTSGSTGLPKGVVLSHRNMVAGAASVASYIDNTPDDRILAVLPLSFDAGVSQLTTGFWAGAQVVLLDFFLPRDAVRVAAASGITGITGVPPLWNQLASVDWPDEVRQSLRYFATTGGVMRKPLLDKLRALFPRARPYLMYGLTEAFRSTYLPPEEVDRRPDSIGKAIPNAEIVVMRDDGTPCDPDEPGELVHRGALVSLGYWQAPDLTAQRFRPLDDRLSPGGRPEMAVWSGDTVVMDSDGYLYFRGRRDEMIKTSGYRVSPNEIEDVVMATGLVTEVVAIGVDDERLGQAVMLAAVPANEQVTSDALLACCREQLANYMVPRAVVFKASLPRNPNGKFDRTALRDELADC